MKKLLSIISIMILLSSCDGDLPVNEVTITNTPSITTEVIKTENSDAQEEVEYNFPETFDFSMVDLDKVTDVTIYFGGSQRLKFNNEDLAKNFIESLAGVEYQINNNEYFSDYVGLDFYHPNNLTPVIMYIYFGENRYEVFESINAARMGVVEGLGMRYQIKDEFREYECLYDAQEDALTTQLTKLFDEYEMPYFSDYCYLHDKCYFNVREYKNEDIIVDRYKTPEESVRFYNDDDVYRFLAEIEQFDFEMYQGDGYYHYSETPIDFPEESEGAKSQLKRLVFKDPQDNEFEIMYHWD